MLLKTGMMNYIKTLCEQKEKKNIVNKLIKDGFFQSKVTKPSMVMRYITKDLTD